MWTGGKYHRHRVLFRFWGNQTQFCSSPLLAVAVLGIRYFSAVIECKRPWCLRTAPVRNWNVEPGNECSKGGQGARLVFYTMPISALRPAVAAEESASHQGMPLQRLLMLTTALRLKDYTSISRADAIQSREYAMSRIVVVSQAQSGCTKDLPSNSACCDLTFAS